MSQRDAFFWLSLISLMGFNSIAGSPFRDRFQQSVMSLKFNLGRRRRRTIKPPSARSARGGGGVFLIGFGLIFALGGAAFTWFLSVEVWQKSHDSRQWEEVPCTIVSSEVGQRSTSDGVNYRPEIVFRYTWQEMTYESDTYRFMDVSSSNRGWARDVVARYSPGSAHTALVNSRNPDEAVLERSLGASFLLTFIPLIFVFVGAGIIVAGAVAHRKKAADASVRSGDTEAPRALRDASLLGLPEFPPEPPPGGRVELKPARSALGKFLGLLFFAIIWNGFIAVLINVSGVLESDSDLPLRLFFGLFTLIGLGLLLGTLYSGIAFFFGPRIRVEASSASLTPGEPFKISWRFTRGSSGPRNLTVLLEGVTEAEYTTGSGKNRSRHTDRKTFLKDTLMQTDDRMRIPQGEVEFSVAESLPHSFEASNNRIRYTLRFQGDIPLMPNLNTEYRLYVPPRPIP